MNTLSSAFLLLFSICSFQLIAKPDTVHIGMYLTSLHDLDLSAHSFKYDAYYWCRYSNPSFDFANEFEVMNSNDVTLESPYIETVGKDFLFSTKTKATVRQLWKTKDYPFDKQTLVISVESSKNDTTKMVFVCDRKNSRYQDSLENLLPEWNIKNTKFSVTSSKYSTNFGSENLGNTSYNSSFNMVIDLERKESFLVLFKLITGVLVAFVISCCVFFIKPYNIDPRFGLCVGGLFATIGNKYIIEGMVPSTNEVTMLDDIHNVTLVFIFLIITISVISLHLYEKGSTKSLKLSRLIDKLSFYIVAISYSSLLIGIIMSHIY
ncbi:MAG: hypothetical protein ACK5F4_06615 [Ignavibacteria bacterium]|jgi:hypothetical protein